jgi:hypothetical protein
MPKCSHVGIVAAVVAGGWDDGQEFEPSDRDVWIRTDLGSVLISADESARANQSYFIAGPDATPELLKRIEEVLNEYTDVEEGIPALDLDRSPAEVAKELAERL